jgi:hypothetical protein
VSLAASLVAIPLPSRAEEADAPVIAAAGDIACPPWSSPTPSACRHRSTSDILAAGGFDAVLTLGDNQYPSGSLADFQASYHDTWGRVKGITHPSLGNHEYGTTGAAGYFDYFGAAAGDRSKGYYSFDLGSWHLIALNSNCALVGGCASGSPQEQWLRADLAAHPNDCTLAYWHHPRFSSGSVHGGDPEMQAFWNALFDFGADVVLNGHEHNYERLAPQTPMGLADPEGITQFVVGTGGRSLYGFSLPPLTNTLVRHSGTFGVLKLTLHPASYEWVFVPEAGKSFTDSGSALCSRQLAPTPPTTVALRATSKRIPVGKRTMLTASVSPCWGREGDLVQFERRRRKAWRLFDVKVSDANCTAGTRTRVRSTTSFRAAVTANEHYLGGISNVVRVRSRPR